MHRAALGAGALSDDWAANRLPRHAERDDFVFLLAREAGEVAGFGYGYTGGAGQWWTEHVARALAKARAGRLPHGRAASRVDRAAALRDRRAARASVVPAAGNRQRSARAAPDAATARSGAPLDADRLAEGAELLRKERVERAGERRLRRRLPAVSRPRQALVRGVRHRRCLTPVRTEPHALAASARALNDAERGSAAVYFPATELTYFATALICTGESVPLNGGIAPPPTSTWCSTTGCAGFSWSRFGPTVPVVPASFRV